MARAPTFAVYDGFCKTKSVMDQHSRILVSISGGSDSDDMVDVVEHLKPGSGCEVDYGCAYRQAGCHSVCERYISWKKELEAEKAYSKQFAPIDAMNLTHEQEKKNRQKRYKGGNQ